MHPLKPLPSRDGAHNENREGRALYIRIAVIAACCISCVLTGCHHASDPIAYHLPKGAKIVYSCTSYPGLYNHQDLTDFTVAFWVVDVDENGLHTIVFHNVNAGINFVGRFTLSPEGVIANIEPEREDNWLRKCFPYTPARGPVKEQQYDEELNTTVLRPYVRDSTGFPFYRPRYWVLTERVHNQNIKPENDRPTLVEWSHRSGVPYRTKYAGRLYAKDANYRSRFEATLKYVSHTPDSDNENLLNELKQYLDIKLEYARQEKELADQGTIFHDIPHFHRWMDEYDRLLNPLHPAWRTTTSRTVRKMIEGDISMHSAHRHSFLRDLANGIMLLERPAPPWELEDANHVIHRLDDYRGKVVLLSYFNFEEAGGNFSPDGMKLAKEMANRFADSPVAVIGMFAESYDNPRLFPAFLQKNTGVRNETEFNHPVLFAQSTKKAYGIQEFPAFVVIDKEGILRCHVSGYVKENLIATLEKVIEMCLQEGAETPSI